ncbi:MAG: hypothetical protein ABIR57_04635 [Aeromicrobium sp.]
MSSDAHTPWTRARVVVNWLNLSTPLGLFMAWIGGASIGRGPRGTFHAPGYRWGFPIGGAFAVGNVILTTHDQNWMDERPAMMRHEDRHCTQYAWCLGVVMVPLAGLTMAFSFLVAGDFSSYNPFERLANLEDGGYPPPTTRLSRRTTRR